MRVVLVGLLPKAPGAGPNALRVTLFDVADASLPFGALWEVHNFDMIKTMPAARLPNQGLAIAGCAKVRRDNWRAYPIAANKLRDTGSGFMITTSSVAFSERPMLG